MSATSPSQSSTGSLTTPSPRPSRKPGTSSTGIPAHRRTPTRRTAVTVKRHDVGDGRKLTTREIAEIVGGTPHNVRARISKGWTGEHLLVPLFERRRPGVARTTTQVIALKLAHAYPHKIPTVKQIQAIHPMDKTTARYWRNACKQAQEEA